MITKTLKKPLMIIFDEATNSLDNVTEKTKIERQV